MFTLNLLILIEYYKSYNSFLPLGHTLWELISPYLLCDDSEETHNFYDYLSIAWRREYTGASQQGRDKIHCESSF